MPFINEDEARAYLYEHQSEARTYDSFMRILVVHSDSRNLWNGNRLLRIIKDYHENPSSILPGEFHY